MRQIVRNGRFDLRCVVIGGNPCCDEGTITGLAKFTQQSRIMQNAELNGVRLEYEVRETGEAVALIHLATYPHLETARIPGIDHTLHLQRPELVAAAVAEFLARHPLSTATRMAP